MRNIALILSFLFLISGNLPALAQSPEAASLDLSDSGRSYLETVGRRVDSRVVYYDPNQAAPELNTNQRVERRRDNADAPALPSRHVFTAIAVLFLAGVLFQVWRFGSPVSVSLTSRPSDAARALRKTDGVVDETDTAPMGLADILAMNDWNTAVVELARSALAKAAEQNGMRRQTSWTSRELLRRLPREAAERLRPLVATAELVQFGNRSVGQDEFTQYAKDIAPLLDGGTA
jgi:hypothetical protein